jgi:hypothetical protein
VGQKDPGTLKGVCYEFVWVAMINVSLMSYEELEMLIYNRRELALLLCVRVCLIGAIAFLRGRPVYLLQKCGLWFV